ncbi:MAG: hypothetical protein JWQ59_2037 [Cryobacterium sp.]|jgi:hypothetical protein|nr:hypothetical protein [Cryobacterium sp.]
MSFVTALLAQPQHVELPIPIWGYGVISLVVFLALAFVIASFKNVSNRHAVKGDAYAAAHGGAPSHGGGPAHSDH